jgi:hypothetical protein
MGRTTTRAPTPSVTTPTTPTGAFYFIAVEGDAGCAVVDAEDYPSLAGRDWTTTTSSGHLYARTRAGTLMHREIMQAPAGLVVHHQNSDTLDNRRANLIVLTPTQHQSTKSGAPNCTSPYKGVHRHRVLGTKRPRKAPCKIWRAQLSYTADGRRVREHLGYFYEPEDAALAYNLRSRELFGEIAYQNPVGQAPWP